MLSMPGCSIHSQGHRCLTSWVPALGFVVLLEQEMARLEPAFR